MGKVQEMNNEIINELRNEIKALKFENKQYVKALKFYANEDNYKAWKEYENATGVFNNVDFDNGEKARTILKEYSE